MESFQLSVPVGIGTAFVLLSTTLARASAALAASLDARKQSVEHSRVVCLSLAPRAALSRGVAALVLRIVGIHSCEVDCL